MNSVILIGRLVRDPELRYTQNGKGMCNFTLAVDKGLSKEQKENYQAQGYPTADFIRIVAWGKTAEMSSNYLAKGLRVAVQGSIQTGSYENQEGQRVYTTDVLANKVEFIDWKQESSSQASNQTHNQANNLDQFPDDDFVPFENMDNIPF